MSTKLKEAPIPKVIAKGNPRLAALLKELYRHMQKDARKERTGCN